LLNTALWPGHPLGRPITGTPKTLDKMSRASLVDYLKSNYVAGGSLVVAAGKVSHSQVVRGVSRYAHRMSARAPYQPIPVSEDQFEPRIRLFTKKTEQTQLALGIRTCSRHDQRRYALRLLNTILGENMSSRLFQVIREDRGLAYSIYSSPSFFEDTGDLVISAGLDTDNLPKTLRLILRELRQLSETPPSAAELRRLKDVAPNVAELKRARDYVIGQMDLSLESTDNQMNWVGEQWLGYAKLVSPSEIKRRFREVTAREIRSIAGDFFRPERLNLALVSPLKSASHLMRLLGSCN